MCLVIFTVLGSIFPSYVEAVAGERDNFFSNDKGVILSENFEKNKKQTAITNKNGILLHGSSFVENGKNGNALQLDDGAYAEIKAEKKLHAKAGSISFWIKPLWEQENHESQTLMSLRWNDGKSSYMAISQGWWEPLGANRLYFILSNQEFAHCSLPYKLEVNTWSMITVTWKSGSDGYCKIFVDGEKVAEHYKSFVGEYFAVDPIYFGSDKGATDQRERNAHAIFDELIIWDRPLSEKEVLQIYEAQGNDTVVAHVKKWKWLDDGLALPWQPKRNSDGVLLESRIMFDEDIHWATSKDNADRILGRLKKAGFNVYVPCVWHGKGTYYPTSLTEFDTRLTDLITKGHDPLAYLIEKAHSLGIEVHPWFTVVRREDSRYPQFYDEGTPDGAYNVHNSEFREFIVKLMLDVVERYDVDGINLDYIRTMGICTSTTCKEDYQQRTGYNFFSDYLLRAVQGAPRVRIQKWQDYAVGEIVRSFSERAKTIKRNLVISVDGHPKSQDMTRPLDGRDEIAWAKSNWIDVIFNMDYNQRVDFELADKVREELGVKEKMVLLFGNYDRIDGVATPRKGDIISNYVNFSRRKWPGSGIAFYIYQMLTDSQVKALRGGPFKEEALPYWANLAHANK